MAKAERGEKRRCLNCSTPFFDLTRTPIICPSCTAVFHVVEYARSSSNYSRYSRPRPTASKESTLADPCPADAVLLDDETDDVECPLPPAEQDDEAQETEVTP